MSLLALTLTISTWFCSLTASILTLGLLTVAVLTVAALTMAVLTVAVITVAVLTVAVLTVAVLTVAVLPAAFAGDVQALIDQPLMRNLADELAVADPALGKRDRRWLAMSCGHTAVYGGADRCALRERGACAAVAAERAKTAFVVQTVQPPSRSLNVAS